MDNKLIAWSFSGAAARAIALFRQAEVSMELGEKPNIIIGQSSGAIVAPILAVAYQDYSILEVAIEMAETLDTSDMFPYKGNLPMNKKGKPSVMGVLRGFTHNHLGWQDIRPMYKKIFSQEHFDMFKESDIKCIGFGVKGKDWSPTMFILNDAESIDDLIDMIESTARISPFVQPMVYKGETYVDGGYISFSPAMWLFGQYQLKQLVCFYSKQTTYGIPDNPLWDKSILSITNQAMNGMSHWLGVKDSIIEELYCKLNNIDYLRIEAPDGYTDEVYETDDIQLIALGLATKEVTEDSWNNFKLIKSNNEDVIS